MIGKRLLHNISVRNILSFGNEELVIPLNPLNVIIGVNGCGKSNFIDVIRLLQSMPKDISIPFISGGGYIEDWIWKGEGSRDNPEIKIHPDSDGIYHGFRLNLNRNRPEIYGEYMYSETKGVKENSYKGERLIAGRQSVLFNDEGGANRVVTADLLAVGYGKIKIYSDNEFGRFSKARMPQNPALDPSFLFEDFSNLAIVLAELKKDIGFRNNFISKLKLFYEKVVNYDVVPVGGPVQLYFEEVGLSKTVPATRLSDGTLRFLCLLVILMHPNPPGLICIEEPELGMHPDVMPVIAELLIDASQRTQLIVTTHSDILLSAIGRTCPEAVVVCEKGPSGTRMTRPDPERLAAWIEEHDGLGEVWLSGLIGGTRW